MSKKLLRWGIAAAGKISEDFAIALQTLPADEHKAIAVAARSLERAQIFAKKHEIPQAYGSYEELAKSNEVDVVYIGVLNPQHYEVTLLMLNNGKHVLCEKPFAMNKKQVQTMIDTAKSKNLFLMEAVWSRFLPAYQHLRSQLKAGALGEIKEVDVSFGFKLSHVDRLNKLDLGGGVVYDLGIYTIQAIQWVFQEAPLKIEAEGQLNEEGVDEDVKAKLTYSGGRVAQMRVSSLDQLKNRAVIKGTKGEITLIDFWAPNKLIDVDGKEKEWVPPKGKFPTNFPNSVCLRYEAEATRQSIFAGELENSTVSHAESLLFAEIEDTIRKQIGALNKYDDA